jgi:hypothetical protein
VKFKNFLSGLVVILAVVAVVSSLPDMRRYIRISTM